MSEITKPYHLFDRTIQFYNALVEDIDRSQHSINIEVFKFHDDYIAKLVLSRLIAACQRGVVVKVLVDDWGTPNADQFFRDFVAAGGKLQVWDKMLFSLNWEAIAELHHRDHRKIFLIDHHISYVGSSNISDYNLEWRELVLRADDKQLAQRLFRIFQYQYLAASRHMPKRHRLRQLQNVSTPQFEILRDVPSVTRSSVKNRYIKLINQAKKSIIIETPYFLPASTLRKTLSAALQRGVKVTIITPKNSDVKSINLLRNRYLAPFFEQGADIRFYHPNNLHAKLLLIDSDTFSIGSTNFDYRSFRHQYELVLIGKIPEITQQINAHLTETLQQTTPFNYEQWKNRSRLDKWKEHLLMPFRSLL